MKVYLNSHGDMDLLTQKDLWSYTAENIDGWWIGPPTFRELPRETRVAMIENSNTRECVVALPWQEFSKGQANRVYAEASGLNVHTLMVYWEGKDYPGAIFSILSRQLIEQVRERNPEYKLISNLRQWHPDYLIDGTPKKDICKEDLDGICYEFRPYRTLNEAFMKQWIDATNFLYDNGKSIYVLLPPDHTTHKEDKNFLKDCAFVVNYFRTHLSQEILDSDKLTFVPANYGYGQTEVATVPEYDACNLHRGVYNGNTVTGVCRWILKTR